MKNTNGSIQVELGPERMVLSDGVQPYLCASKSGIVYLQAQVTPGPEYIYDDQNQHNPIGNALSRDNGRTWERWIPSVWREKQATLEGACIQLADGTLVMIEWIAATSAKHGIFTGRLWESTDDFGSVNKAVAIKVRVPQARRNGFDDGGHPWAGVCFHRTLVELSGGDLLATAYCTFEEDTVVCSYESKMLKQRSILLRSSDRGRNWRYISTIAVDPNVGEEGFNEPVMVRLTKGPHKGRLVCLLRTGPTTPIHQVYSDDEGATWSKPRALRFRGVDPDLVEMPDGTLVCSFGRRTKKPSAPIQPKHSGCFVAISSDSGNSWQEPVKIPIEPHSNTAFTTCYTALHKVGSRELIVFYDVGRWNRTIRYISSRTLKLR